MLIVYKFIVNIAVILITIVSKSCNGSNLAAY